MKVCISQFSLQMFFKVISKVKPCDSGQKRKDKQQRGTDSVTETWINKHAMDRKTLVFRKSILSLKWCPLCNH